MNSRFQAAKSRQSSLANLAALTAVAWVLAWTFSVIAQPTGEPPAETETETAAEGAAEDTSDGELDEDSGDDASPAADSPRLVYGRIDSEINLTTAAFVTRLVEEAKQTDADILLIELNTFGGRIDAAIAIRDALLDAPQKTVIFINKRAISAGALISYSCHTIAISPGGTIGAAMPVSGNPSEEMPEAVQEKYVSYFREEMRVTAETRGRDPDIAEAMVDRDKVVEGVTEDGKLLTLGTSDAVRLGVADFEAENLDQVLERIGASAAGLVRVERSWSEDMAGFLTSPAIASMLLFGMMVFGYMEMQSPGFGFFGAAAIFCFLLLYLSHYLTNLAGHEELLLFALGLILLIAEVFLLPGVGIMAVLGATAILASVVLVISAGDWSDFSFENPITLDAMQQVALVLVASFVAMILIFKYLVPASGSSTHGGLLLAATLGASEGYRSHEDEPELAQLVGHSGKALTQLRPSGRAVIDGRRVHVETEGDWIDKDEEVVVIRRVEGRLMVRRAAKA